MKNGGCVRRSLLVSQTYLYSYHKIFFWLEKNYKLQTRLANNEFFFLKNHNTSLLHCVVIARDYIVRLVMQVQLYSFSRPQRDKGESTHAAVTPLSTFSTSSFKMCFFSERLFVFSSASSMMRLVVRRFRCAVVIAVVGNEYRYRPPPSSSSSSA